MKIAIVGSQEKYWTPEQRAKVVKLIEKLYDPYDRETIYEHPKGGAYTQKLEPVEKILVSGACPYGGVDIWAEIVADMKGVKKIIYPARTNDREGYRERNYEIAETCDVLYCFDPRGRGWSGGKWTMKMAKELGKETHLVEIEQ